MTSVRASAESDVTLEYVSDVTAYWVAWTSGGSDVCAASVADCDLSVCDYCGCELGLEVEDASDCWAEADGLACS